MALADAQKRDGGVLPSPQRHETLELLTRLAGGLAHNGNNNLAAVKAFIDMSLSRVTDPKVREYLGHAIEALADGASLNSRLLFGVADEARQSQVYTRDGLLALMTMIEFTLTREMRLEIALPLDLWPMKAEARQLQQAIFAFSLAAQQAPSRPTLLTIRAFNMASQADVSLDGQGGDYVCIELLHNGKAATAFKHNDDELDGLLALPADMQPPAENALLQLRVARAPSDPARDHR